MYRAHARIESTAPYPIDDSDNDEPYTEEQLDAAADFTLASVLAKRVEHNKVEATSFRMASELAEKTLPNTNFSKRMSEAAALAQSAKSPSTATGKPGDINASDLEVARHNCHMFRVRLSDEPRDRRHDLSLFESFKTADLPGASIDLFYCSKVIRVTGPALYSTPSLLPLIFVYT